MNRWIVPAAVLALVLSGAACAQEGPEEPVGSFVPGQVLVKFADETEIAAALRGEGEASDRAIAEELTRALEPIAVPLRLMQRTSGGEVVLILDGATLVETLTSAAAEQPGVSNAELVPPPRTVTPPGHLDFRIAWDTESGDGLGALAARLQRTTELPLEVRETDAGDPVVSLDLRRLTLDLLDRLRELEGVDYAQPNYTLQKFGSKL